MKDLIGGIILAVAVTVIGFLGGAFSTGGVSVAVAVEVELPKMERAGSIMINNVEVRLWTFDFEGRRCLWATMSSKGGLSCWDKKGVSYE